MAKRASFDIVLLFENFELSAALALSPREGDSSIDDDRAAEMEFGSES
jgi:hypothetical protein